MSLFLKKRKELDYQEETNLFERCLSVTCNCLSPEQRIVASRYVSWAAKKISDDLWDQEMWIKAINENALLHILPKRQSTPLTKKLQATT